MNVGEKIKRYRKSKGMSIDALAKKSNMSASYISQLERGLISPSLGALQKVSSGLEMHVPDFFEYDNKSQESKDAASSFQVVRKNARKGLTYAGSDAIYQLITPDLRRNVEVLIIKSPVGSTSGMENFVHEGEECGLIIEGKMEYWINGESVILEEGDSVYFRSNVPHRWRNVGDVVLRALWVISPPSF